jgi:FMN phosphatase YigB (HAD superfamily)
MTGLDDKALRRSIASAKIVSFDIFDTLVRRPFLRPVDVFFALEKDLRRPGFARARIEAERLARTTLGKGEVTLDDIYGFLGEPFAALKAEEISCELRACIRNDEAGGLYDYADSLGKPLILVSDMYLPRAAIEKILENAGYAKHRRLFLSNEAGTQKVSRLFAHVAEQLGCACRDILHIGDNPIGDVDVPRRLGVAARRYQPAPERLTSQGNWLAREIEDLSRGDDPDLSYLLSFVARFSAENAGRNDIFFDIGASVVWPMSVLFCSWLVELARAKSISRAYFLSRDGFLFKKVFDALFAAQSGLRAEKLFVSRRAIALPFEIAVKGNLSLLTYGKDESAPLSRDSLWALMDVEDADLRAKFDAFMERDFAGEAAPAYAVDLFIADYPDEVRAVFEAERRRAERYLEQAGLFEGDCLIVDIGWGGTMQRALMEMTEARQQGNAILGAYLGSNRTCGLANDVAFGFAINRELPQSRARAFNIDLVELFFTVPAASVRSYAEQDGRMAPTFIGIGSKEALRQRASTRVNQGLDAMTAYFLAQGGLAGRRLSVGGCPEGVIALLRRMWRIAVENRKQFEQLPVLPGHSEEVVWRMHLEKPPAE